MSPCFAGTDPDALTDPGSLASYNPLMNIHQRRSSMEDSGISMRLTEQLIKEATGRKHAEALIDFFVKNAPGALAVIDEEFKYRSVSDRWYENEGAKGVIVSMEVLNKQKALESDLKRASNMLEMVVESSGLGVWHWTEDGDVMEWDAGMYAIFQVSADDFTGREDFHLDRMVESDKEALRELMESAKARKSEYRTVYKIWTPKGSRIVKEYGRAYMDDDTLKMAGICEDVTGEEQARQELAELNQQLEAKVKQRTEELDEAYKEAKWLTYALAHDLHAPLRAISGYVHVIKEDFSGSFPIDLKNHFDRIQLNSSRVFSMVDELLAYSRVVHQKLSFQDINGAELLKAALDRCSADLKGEVACSGLPNFNGDNTTLRQAFANLIKYLDVEGQELNINGRTENGKAVISFSGSAMSSQGVRLDGHTADGVGLSLIKRIININYGRLDIKKEEQPVLEVVLIGAQERV